MNALENIKDLCRVCRKNCVNFSESIHNIYDGVLIHEMMLKTCPIDINIGDPVSDLLPKVICFECLGVVASAYQLQKTCIESDQYFRSILCSDAVVKTEKEDVDVKQEYEVVEHYEFLDEGAGTGAEIDAEPDYDMLALFPSAKKRRRTKATFSFNPRPVNPKYPRGLYRCNFCCVELKPRETMTRHMYAEHDPIVYRFPCKYCVQRFRDEKKKELHEKLRHHRETDQVVITCELCGATGISQDGMKHHILDDHQHEDDEEVNDQSKTIFNPRPINKADRYDDVYYACNFCHVKQKPRKNLLRHMQLKHDPVLLPYSCKFCISRFKDTESKYAHEKTHKGYDSKIYTCEICNATGYREIGMQHHKMDDHGIDMDEGGTTDTEERKRSKKSEGAFHPRPLNTDVGALPYEETWYVCNFCDKKMKPKKSMLRHMKRHNPVDFPYACEFCIVRCETKDSLGEHMESFHKNEECPNTVLFCDICGVSGDNKQGMENHMIDDHLDVRQEPKKQMYKCSSCQAKFLHKRSLLNHKLIRHQEIIKCDKCEEVFHDKKNMNHHIMMVHEQLYRKLEDYEIEHNLKCCKCEVNHASEKELFEHLNVHRASFKSERTKCNFCPRNLKSFHEFVEHSKYHSAVQTYECLQCKKKLPFNEKLVNHVKGHKRYDCYKVECKKCTQKFRSVKDLEIHDKVKHNNETLFICPMCAKSLSSANGLDQHIRYVHNKEQEKKFACRFCPMKFILKTKLTRHEAVHSTERQHVCELCGSSFKHSEGLKLHMKRHDGTLVRKHECTQCSHKFTTKHRLDQHMMTHTGLKPHECKFPSCDRAYASKGDLVKHMQKMHVGDSIYQCEKCPRAFRLIVELREHQQEHGVPREMN